MGVKEYVTFDHGKTFKIVGKLGQNANMLQ